MRRPNDDDKKPRGAGRSGDAPRGRAGADGPSKRTGVGAGRADGARRGAPRPSRPGPARTGGGTGFPRSGDGGPRTGASRGGPGFSRSGDGPPRRSGVGLGGPRREFGATSEGVKPRRRTSPSTQRGPAPIRTQRKVELRASGPKIAPEKLLERMPWASLRPLLAGSDSDRELAIARLRTFGLELLRWNQGVSNLVSHDDELRLVDRHIAESLAGVAILNKLGCKEIVDFGSGGGFPALPLALAGVGKHWTLVESRRNKTLFLRRALQELGAGHIDVVTARLESVIADDPESLRCDGFTSRATMKAAPTLIMAAQIVEPGGHAVLWKGSGVTEELAADESWQESWNEPVVHPIADGPNSIVVFSRKK